MTTFEYLTSDLDALAYLENYPQWIVDEMQPYLGLRLVEIGAGIGTLTKRLARHLERLSDSKLDAFEPAANLYPHLQQQMEKSHPELIRTGRLIMHHGYFESASNRFDTVIMINVLEHIREDDAILRDVYRSLSPGGHVVVFVPALSWLYSPFDKSVGHYRRYALTELNALFIRTGFSVITSKYFDLPGVLPWYLFYVLGRSKSVNPRFARIYDACVVPLTRWLENRYPPFMGKNILIVGRK